MEIAFQNYVDTIQASVEKPREWLIHFVKGIIIVKICEKCAVAQVYKLIKCWVNSHWKQLL
jgi:hypothetical protein